MNIRKLEMVFKDGKTAKFERETGSGQPLGDAFHSPETRSNDGRRP